MPPIASVPTFTIAGSQTAPTSWGSTSVASPVPQFTVTPSIPAAMAETSTLATAPSGMAIPPKLAQKIWRGDFVEMTELLPDQLGQLDPPETSGSKDADKKRSMVMVQQQPTRTQDLLAYESLVVHAARKYKVEGWTVYDKNFRKRAAAHPGEKRGELNTPFWTLTFCSAEPREHCYVCLSIDYPTTACGDYEGVEGNSISRSSAATQPQKHRTNYNQRSRQPICINWNKFSCTSTTCEYQHICLECHQRHKVKDCPMTRGGSLLILTPGRDPGRTESKTPYQVRLPLHLLIHA